MLLFDVKFDVIPFKNNCKNGLCIHFNFEYSSMERLESWNRSGIPSDIFYSIVQDLHGLWTSWTLPSMVITPFRPRRTFWDVVLERARSEAFKAILTVPRLVSGTWSASTSPARSPSPTRAHYYPNRSKNYGTTSLEQRSRSPSPTGDRGPPPPAHHRFPHHRHHHHQHQHPHQHSYPVLVTRRGHGRKLPPTPSKPSTLQLRPASINFPKLNASPTHCPPSQAQGQYCPLSFEQAVAIGRGGRVLPSPVPNGYKPGQRPRRHSDSDEDDWC